MVSPTGALAAQTVVLMTLTRTFVVLSMQVSSVVSSEAVVTHSSLLAEYAVQSDLAALWSQMSRSRASGRGLRKRLLHLNSVLCLRPTPARPDFGRGGPRGSPGRSGTGTGREEPGETLSISVWKVRVGSTFWPGLAI